MISIAIAIAFLIIILSILIANPTTTLLHELGHAFATLLLTKAKRVDIYIGSYGKKSPINFRVGKLYFHIIFAFFKGGMCSAELGSNYVKRIIIVLAGPLFSFFTACLFALVAFDSDVHGVVKFYFFILVIWSGYSLYINLNPKRITETLDSDGEQIRFLLRVKKRYSDYIAAIKGYNSWQYDLAAEKFAIIVKLVPDNTKILRYLIDSLQRADFIESAESYLIELQKHDELKTEEMLFYGYILAVSGRFDQANEAFKAALKKSPDHLEALYNLGYGLALVGDLATATSYLEKTIELDKEHAPSYGTLGYVELLKGNLESGRQLIEKSLAMDPTYAYSYQHLACYYLKTGDKEKARLNINHAAFMDRRINLQPLIEELES